MRKAFLYRKIFETPNWKRDADGKYRTGLHGKSIEELAAIRAKRSPDSFKTGSKKDTDDYFYHDLPPVHMPEFEIGACIRCHNWDIELGDGLCIECYDSLCDKSGSRFNRSNWLSGKLQ